MIRVPRNLNQQRYRKLLENTTVPLVVGTGPAGTGKTLFACNVGAAALRSGQYKKIVITRPAVSVDEQHGFLPGTLDAKMDPWVRPMFDVFSNYFSPKSVKDMLYDNIIEICPLAYMRGRTFDRSWIIADEMQNSTPNQMRMVLTRIGENSKMVVTGDLDQHEKGFDQNGLADLMERLGDQGWHETLQYVRFTKDDVERSQVVKDVLRLYV
jgi:phosphate starvation-inducible PhoH-like protein